MRKETKMEVVKDTALFAILSVCGAFSVILLIQMCDMLNKWSA